MITLAQLVQFFKNIWVKRIIALLLINSKSGDDAKEAWDKKQDTVPLGTLWWLMQNSPKQSSNFLCEKILDYGDIDPCLSAFVSTSSVHALASSLAYVSWVGATIWSQANTEPFWSPRRCACATPFANRSVRGRRSLPLEKSWHLAGVSMVFHQLISLQRECLATCKSHRAAKTRWGNDRQSLVGQALPFELPSCACPPAETLSLQPPPVPWLREPAEVQPTFATCRGKMSQSLRLLTMTEAQLTHVCLVRGIGAAEKCCTSDWCAKFHFTCCKEKLCPLSLSSRQFLIGYFVSCNFIVICSTNEPVCVLTGEKNIIFLERLR